MSKVILATVVVLLALPGLGLAGDIDGIWLVPDQGLETVVAIRENAGLVVATAFDLAEWPEGSYRVLARELGGNVCHIATTVWSEVDASYTVTLTSATSATVHVDACEPRNAGDECDPPPGASFDLVKFF